MARSPDVDCRCPRPVGRTLSVEGIPLIGGSFAFHLDPGRVPFFKVAGEGVSRQGINNHDAISTPSPAPIGMSASPNRARDHEMKQ